MDAIINSIKSLWATNPTVRLLMFVHGQTKKYISMSIQPLIFPLPLLLFFLLPSKEIENHSKMKLWQRWRRSSKDNKKDCKHLRLVLRERLVERRSNIFQPKMIEQKKINYSIYYEKSLLWQLIVSQKAMFLLRYSLNLLSTQLFIHSGCLWYKANCTLIVIYKYTWCWLIPGWNFLLQVRANMWKKTFLLCIMKHSSYCSMANILN